MPGSESNSSVTTRSFRNGDRFWEISWSGLFAETASGVIGKRGRAREASFQSTKERDAFIAAQIAKNLKKGFTECDPATLADPDVTDPFQRTVEYVAKRMRRDAFVPELEPGPGSSDASRLGGLPWLLPSEDSVDCGVCFLPMSLVFQLRRVDVPEAWRHLFTRDMIQFFYCNSLCQADEGWRPFARSSLVRHVDLSAPGLGGRPSPDVPSFPEKIVRGWTRRDDYPLFQDIEREGLDVDSLEVSAALQVRGDVPLKGEKLGGWPLWIQEAYPLSCTCGAPMQPFFQVDSLHSLPIKFGDLGIGWTVACSRCKTMTFVWQSC